MRGPKWFFWLFFWLCCAFTPAVVHGATAQQESEGQSAQELLEDMQLEEIQQMVAEMLG